MHKATTLSTHDEDDEDENEWKVFQIDDNYYDDHSIGEVLRSFSAMSLLHSGHVLFSYEIVEYTINH